MYTDGLASLSIFMEPDLSKLPGSEGISQRGALSLVTRAVGAQALIAVGELPAAALKKVAESIGPGTGARN